MAIARIEGVTKRYGRVTALDGVDIALDEGEVLALLGPNGAGKTTTVRLLMGISRPDSGSVRLFGGDPGSLSARRRCGVMLQVSGLPATLRVAEHLELFSAYYPSPLSLPRVMALAGLEGLERRPVSKLSGGQRQRLMFALALVGDPAVLFLDEPTVGLDVTLRRRFWRTIRKLAADGRTILLTTHYLEEADSLADRIVVLNEGRVVAEGAPDLIKSRVPGRRIRCRTRLDADAVSNWPGVQRARREDELLEVLCSDAEDVVRRLLEEDRDLDRLEVAGAGLEDAFLQLTGRVEREAA